MTKQEEIIRLQAENEELKKALEAWEAAFKEVYESHSRLVNK